MIKLIIGIYSLKIVIFNSTFKYKKEAGLKGEPQQQK